MKGAQTSQIITAVFWDRLRAHYPPRHCAVILNALSTSMESVYPLSLSLDSPHFLPPSPSFSLLVFPPQEIRVHDKIFEEIRKL